MQQIFILHGDYVQLLTLLSVKGIKCISPLLFDCPLYIAINVECFLQILWQKTDRVSTRFYLDILTFYAKYANSLKAE